MASEIGLPADVRQRLMASGPEGVRWLAALPRTVAELERRWSITVGRTLAGGTAGFVAEAVTAGGAEVILKIAMPLALDVDDSFDRSVTALRIAGGKGAVELLAHDAELSALLLERLGRPLRTLGLPVREQLAIVVDTVRQLWVPVPAGAALPTGADKARWLAAFIETTWITLDRPCAEKTIERAVEYATARAEAFDPHTAVLVHGDAHAHNTLEAGDRAFKLIDLEGLRSEPANDLAVPMREYHDELLAGDAVALGLERARFLAELTGVDETAIWQWGFVERVSTGLYVKSLSFDWWGPYLRVADRWAEA